MMRHKQVEQYGTESLIDLNTFIYKFIFLKLKNMTTLSFLLKERKKKNAGDI